MRAGSGHRAVDACRICSSAALTTVVSLGETPLANALVRPADADVVEERYPLRAVRCESCGLVQLDVVVDPSVMFCDYPYATSASAPMVEHFDAYAGALVERFGLAGAFTIEVGSNDGAMLASLARSGARPLGIEPAVNLARRANAAGLETREGFFGPDLAAEIVRERGPARAIIANNVLAHIDDLRGVLEALDAALTQDGVFVAEFPYLSDLIESVEYDTIYHEHLSYFSIGPLVRLFEGAGLELFDAERQAVHGGSIRIHVGRRGRHSVTPGLEALRRAEETARLHEAGTYTAFAERVRESRNALRQLLAELAAGSRLVAAIGATAKGNTLLNYCGLGPGDIAYIGDSTPAKQGLLAPGSRIPIRPDDVIERERPPFVLLLAWNYADAIMRRFSDHIRAGGRFVHPIPLARLLP